MKFKYLAMAGAMLVAVPTQSFSATPAPNSTVVVNGGTGIPSGQLFSDAFNVLAGSFKFDLLAWGSNKNSAGNVTANLLDSAMNIVAFIGLDVDGKTVRSTSSEPFSLAAGLYRFKWSGQSTGTGSIHADVSLLSQGGSTVAVPGPEAGAGIGALAMAGVAYMVSRRRKIVAAK